MIADCLENIGNSLEGEAAFALFSSSGRGRHASKLIGGCGSFLLTTDVVLQA